MKNIFKLSGMMILVLVFGMVFIGCDNGTTEPTNPFVGTWTQDGSGGKVKVTVTENTWIAKNENVLYNSGTYVYSGDPLVEWTVTDKGQSTESVGGKGDAAVANGKLIVSSFSDAHMNGTYSK